MTDPEKREDISEEHIPHAHHAKPAAQRGTQDELTAGEETIAEHIATGVPADATIVGVKQPQPSAHLQEIDEVLHEDLEESDVTELTAAGTEAGGEQKSSS